MRIVRVGRGAMLLGLVATLGACSALGGLGARNADAPERNQNPREEALETSSIWDLFKTKSQDNKVAVNKYLWSASLEVLSFLPVQSVDPFTGVIVTGYGTPPGGGTSYRATVLIDDPALDARSLNVALQTRGGRSVSKATARAVEDAILSRAREMRSTDSLF